MVQKRPAILDFQIKNHLIYYKFPKYYLGFYSICLYDTNIMDILIKSLTKTLNKEKIFGVIDIVGENSFLFIKFKNKSIKAILSNEKSILRSLLSIKKKNFKLLAQKELENSFFYFVEFSQMKNVHISIKKKEKCISLIDYKIAVEQNIFKFKVGNSFFRENQVRQLILFFRTMKIKGYFLFSHKSVDFLRLSFILISNSFEKLINFLNFNKSLTKKSHLKLVEISKYDFINLIKRKQLSNSILIENTDFYHFLKIINSNMNKEQDLKKNANFEKRDKTSLRKNIITILNELLISFTINSKSDILINPFKVRVLILEHNFNLLLNYFRTQEYSRNHTILFFSNKDEQKALIDNTSIKKLRRIEIFSKDDLDSFRFFLNQRKNLILTNF